MYPYRPAFALALAALTLSLAASCGPAPAYYAPPPPHPQPYPQPYPTPDPQPAPSWDSRGWTQLGRHPLQGTPAPGQGELVRERIAVRDAAGSLDKLTLVLTGGEVDLQELTATYDDGSTFAPTMRGPLGASVRELDLPPSERALTLIDLGYRRRAGAALTLEVWGWAAPAPAPAPEFDGRGWTRLGTLTPAARGATVSGPLARAGRIDRVTLHVTGGVLEITGLQLGLGDGGVLTPAIRHRFVDGARTRILDLPGNDRALASASVSYQVVSGAPSIELWGRDVGSKPTPAWDPKGWTKLGDSVVDGRRDRDSIKVAHRGRIDQVTLVVTDADLDLDAVTFTFASGAAFSPAGVQQRFQDGQRSRVIDLPGNDRMITVVDVAYRNVAGSGRARLEVWGRDVGSRPPPIWDATGWTKVGGEPIKRGLAEKTVRLSHKARIDQLTLVALAGELDVTGVVVDLVGGNQLRPALRHVFKDGARAQRVDLPGNVRSIASVTLTFARATVAEATVEVWGRDAGTTAPPLFDARGWVRLAGDDVARKADKASLPVGHTGKIDQLTLVVGESDLELTSALVTFVGGSSKELPAAHTFKDGARTLALALPGNELAIKSVLLRLRKGAAGVASVELYGRYTGSAPAPAPWDATGWKALAAGVLDPTKAEQALAVAGGQARFQRFAIVIGGALVATSVTLEYGDKSTFAVPHDLSFTAAAPAQIITVDRSRELRRLTFRATGLAAGSALKLEVFGK
jgi:hypothetical protein